MTSVGLVPHPERPLAAELARRIAAWLTGRGHEVRVPHKEAVAAGLIEYAVDDAGFGDGIELVISLGGDGTMLHSVYLSYPRGASVVGVNLGQLGYLTTLEPHDFEDLDAVMPVLVSGAAGRSERMMLSCTVERDGSQVEAFGLNEVVLEKVDTGRLVRLEVLINDDPFTTYAADGVIVATPTGSTAYSFSARGPIVSPVQRCLVLTPVSPHMLFDRALVLAPEEALTLVVVDGREVALTVDGRDLGRLAPGDRVTCRAAPDPLHVVELRPSNFHRILKTKFALPDR